VREKQIKEEKKAGKETERKWKNGRKKNECCLYRAISQLESVKLW
jgi:hypothetical protein